MMEAAEIIKQASQAPIVLPVQSHIRNGDGSSFMSGYSQFAHCDVGNDFISTTESVGNSAFDALAIIANISREEAEKYHLALYSLWVRSTKLSDHTLLIDPPAPATPKKTPRPEHRVWS